MAQLLLRTLFLTFQILKLLSKVYSSPTQFGLREGPKLLVKHRSMYYERKEAVTVMNGYSLLQN